MNPDKCHCKKLLISQAQFFLINDSVLYMHVSHSKEKQYNHIVTPKQIHGSWLSQIIHQIKDQYFFDIRSLSLYFCHRSM
jgi:hypothetical protein